jgi:hypothetical protein
MSVLRMGCPTTVDQGFVGKKTPEDIACQLGPHRKEIGIMCNV